jgi:uncharacterized protein YndB with AHSA1/START domain
MPTADRGTTRFALPSDTTIAARRFVEAPRQEVFDAWTMPGHIQRWMLGPSGWTMPVCEVDLRAGGAWRFGWRGPDGRELGMEGEYREVSAPERLVATERWGDPWPETLTTVVFGEDDEGTTITCITAYPSKGARDAALETGVKDGMNQSFDRLTAFLD